MTNPVSAAPIVHALLVTCGLLLLGAAVFVRVRESRLCSGALYRVVAPPISESPIGFFLALHGLLRSPWRRLVFGQPSIGLELVGSGGQVQFYVWVPDGEMPFVSALLRASYLGVAVTPVETDPMDGVGAARSYATIGLYRHRFLPIATTSATDPLAPLMHTLARATGEARIRLSLVVRPKPNRWRARARAYAEGLRSGRPSLLHALIFGPQQKTAPSAHQLAQARQVAQKTDGLGFDCAMRIETAAADRGAAREYVRAVAACLRPFDGPNSFAVRRVWRGLRFADRLESRRVPLLGAVLLTADELAAVWRLPAEAAPHVDVVRSPKIPAPIGTPTSGRIIGVAEQAGREIPVGQSVDDSRRHTHVDASTGAGKTNLFINLALQDAAAGRGFGFFDPQGDAIDTLLAHLPLECVERVVLIDPRSRERSVGVNPLAWSDSAERFLIVDNMIGLFKRLFEGWGPRTEWLLRNVFLTLLHRRDATLADVIPLLTDSAVRSDALRGVTDLQIRQFWSWYERLSDSQRTEVISPTLNRIGSFLSNPAVRRLTCQPRSTVDLQTLMDSGGILLANLSHGQWGESTSNMIGTFLLLDIWRAALRRAAIPPEKRRDWQVYIDEFQTFVGAPETFSDALARGRAFRLCLNLANQSLAQLNRELREAVLANTRTRIVMACGQHDARSLAVEFAPLDAEALMNLPKYHAAVRLAVDGETLRPFTIRLQPPPEGGDAEYGRELAEQSLLRYGRPVADIDRELAQRAHLNDATGELGEGARR